MESLVRGDADELVTQIRTSTGPDAAFAEFNPRIAAERERHAKLIAFYLPQFHSIPENDAWWGEGFTDWRNVARGVPRFAGHYQPRIPRDLGYYDLSEPEVMRRQIELASAAGLHGFSFYYYSFSGKRLLERPLEAFLSNSSLDFPFCVTWANENWTRRWDGLDEETLIRQEHNPDDDPGLVDDLQRHFEDPRYIRIDGRPLFLVYRFDVLANARETVARWRELWRERHGEDPLILLVQSFEDDPRPYGADGAVEFPPQRMASWDNTIGASLDYFDPQFAGYVLDYESLLNASLQRQAPAYPWVRGITPSWDNDARRQGGGTVLHGSTPDLYERWLTTLVEAAREDPPLGEPMVFINAWNEWAEGAYLEPDVRFGGAYLNATARAVTADPAPTPPPPQSAPPGEGSPEGKTKVLLVGHDAHPHGAQMNLRGLGERLRHQFGCEVSYLLVEGGPLTTDYKQHGEVHISGDPERMAAIVRQLRKRGYSHAFINSLAAAGALTPLKEAGFRVLSFVQELPSVIRAQGLESAAEAVATNSNTVVFPAEAVAESFSEFAPVPSERAAIRPQGLFRQITGPDDTAVTALRSELGIPGDSRVVLNVGYADRRKGIDLFLEAAAHAAAEAPLLEFVWLGNLNAEALELRAEAERVGTENLHFADFTEDVSPYLALADVFFLSSREDPFPSAVLEALDAGLPLVAFSGSGGSEELAGKHGALVSAEDVPAAVRALSRCATEDDPAAAEARRREVRDNYQWDTWAFEILRLLHGDLRKVSVVVPNYNYADHLEERMTSIFDQTHPIFELIVLDDGSTDRSLERLAEIRERTGRRFRVVASEENSGSVFRQWAQACELARGDYLWIAEADDRSQPEFLALLTGEINEGVAFTFSDSSQIDGSGKALASSYQDYYRQSANGLMQTDFVLEGDQFVRKCLLERNLVLNVSAVLWNRRCLQETLEHCLNELLDYRLTGDWHLYAATALSGKRVAYVSDPLNVHRRHENGVTDSLEKARHLEEVRRVHSKLSDWLPTNEDDRVRMESYEAELQEQFGLTGPSQVGTRPTGSRTDPLENRYRFGRGQGIFKSQEEWLESGLFYVDLLCRTVGRDDLSDVDLLDVGCGTLLVKTLRENSLPIGHYTGVDAGSDVIDWLHANVSDPRFEFHHLDAHNEMYNPNGKPFESFDLLPVGPRRFDLICLFSVFTHLAPHDFVTMLHLLRRHVKQDGTMLFSLFIDDPDHPSIFAKSLQERLNSDDPEVRAEARANVERVEQARRRAARDHDPRFVDEDPDNPLAVARYSKDYALELFEGTGWEIDAIHPPPPERYIQHHIVCHPI